jgi:hypothetical protein
MKQDYKYKVVRVGDSKTKYGNVIDWVEWNGDRTFNSKHDTIGIGRSLVLDFHYGTFKWMTTPVTEILENKENYIKFNTENSTYEVFIEQDKTSI